jgi:lysophospholipase L1-like esterase
MTPSPKKLILFPLVALVLCVALGEIVARLSGAGAIDVVPQERYWSLDLHTNLYGRMDGRRTVSIIGREIPAAKAPGELRVFCLGSSSTFGAGLADRLDSYPDLLDRELPDIGVFNAGFGGYNSFQLLVLLTDVLIAADPDLVVFYYGDNEGLGESAKPFYHRARAIVASLRAAGVTEPDELSSAVNHGTDNPLALRAYAQLDRSVAFRWLRNKILVTRYLADLAKAKEQTTQHEPSPVKILVQMADTAAANGFKLLFVPEMGAAGGHINEPYYQHMCDLCQAGRAICLDPLDPAFPPPEPEMFIDSNHLNPSGHRWLAGVLRPMIEELVAAPSEAAEVTE